MTTATIPTTGWGRVHTALLIVVLAAGVAGRVAWISQPIDHRLLAAWHQTDYTQIARNFYRDSLNILYPKIDWRGDTPGYVEMEFPVLPWLGAVLCRVFGYHEALLRLPPVLISIVSLVVFLRICRRFLKHPAGILIATAAFAANPLLVVLGNALIPDPLMALLCMIAVDAIWRWQDDQRPAAIVWAAAAAAAAMLSKASAAYLGFLMAYAVLRTLGRRAFSDPKVYLAAAVALVPPAAWYLWAARFWWTYGNSLGVSNEWHFIGWDMLAPPVFLYLLIKWEALAVFSPPGCLLAAASVRTPRRGLDRVLVWYVAVWIFYVVTARTSAFVWSFYYHCGAVAPACLLMGAGAQAFARGTALPALTRRTADAGKWVGGILTAAALAALVVAAAVLISRRDGDRGYLRMRTCAMRFQPLVPPDSMIVVRGGAMVDGLGHPAAHNEPMMFAWMDRKGFNYGDQELSVATLDRIAARGGRYWIADPGWLRRDGLARMVEERYLRIATCEDAYYLYDLWAGRDAPGDPIGTGSAGR